jgi:hypothetical protein
MSMPRFLPAMVSAVIVVVVAALALVFYANQHMGIGTPSPIPATASPESTATPSPTSAGGMWPQTTLEEVRAAQQHADAGDPDYTWQVDSELVGDAEPFGAEITERFLREGLGWEEFRSAGYADFTEGGGPDEVLYIRCAPGRTNPLSSMYPDMDPESSGCAPTLDDFRWETVRFTVDQPTRRGPSGIWVVTAWEMLQPGEPQSTREYLYGADSRRWQVEQAAPPSHEEVTALLQAFLAARLDGEGAEEYLLPPDAEGPRLRDWYVPLLYATTGGTPYERSEIERVQGPVWPTGWSEFKVRLSAEDGTVVEQSFVVVRQRNGGRLGLVYGREYGAFPTTENGQAPYSLLNGLIETGCEAGPAPADADAFARSVRSNPHLEATAPVAVSVGGIDALRMDVIAAPGGAVCDGPLVLARGVGLLPTDRMRLYLLDVPGGSARMLAIAVIARDPYAKVQVAQPTFEQVVEEATPIVESIEFHTA